MSKRVRQTVTIDVKRLEEALVWHLNLDKSLRKLSQLKVHRSSREETLELINECRILLGSLDMTLSEFQEIYEALTGEQPITEPVPEPEPELLQEDLEKEINDRMIGNLLSNLDKAKK
tara:strand:- start:62 stop:415 length:354 start_codon:yes stop_codon:yes gene_type:complete